MPLRYGLPYWLAHGATDESRSFGPLRGRLGVDVAIIGGGFTGCLTAYLFASAGVRVAVLERGRIGHGSAGASTALLMQAPDRDLSELTRWYGARRARAIWRLSRRAVRDLITTLQPLSCGLRSATSLQLATDREGRTRLRRDHRARRAAGLGGRLLDAGALRRRSGARAAGAILVSGDGLVDPYRATVALAEAAANAGALIFEHSDVLHVTGDRSAAHLATARGRVACDHAIIATGFATPAFKPLQAQFTMSTTYVIATDPIGASDRARMGDGRVMFWDTERPYHYFRWTDDGRILFGGEDRSVPPPARRHRALVRSARRLRDRLTAFYPELTPPRIAFAWDGVFATTPDGLPYIGAHPDYPRQLFALGYGGNGMTFASLAAGILLRHYQGRPRASDALFRFSRLPERGSPRRSAVGRRR